MDPWQIFLLKLAFFIVAVPILGFALLLTVEYVRSSWKSNNRRKKWLGMCVVAGIYLILRGLFL